MKKEFLKFRANNSKSSLCFELHFKSNTSFLMYTILSFRSLFQDYRIVFVNIYDLEEITKFIILRIYRGWGLVLRARIVGVVALTEGLANLRVIEGTYSVGDVAGSSYSGNPLLRWRRGRRISGLNLKIYLCVCDCLLSVYQLYSLVYIPCMLLLCLLLLAWHPLWLIAILACVCSIMIIWVELLVSLVFNSALFLTITYSHPL